MNITRKHFLIGFSLFATLFFLAAFYDDLTTWEVEKNVWNNLTSLRVSVAPFMVSIILLVQELKKNKANLNG